MLYVHHVMADHVARDIVDGSSCAAVCCPAQASLIRALHRADSFQLMPRSVSYTSMLLNSSLQRGWG